jgi:hypothetical protein
VGGGGGGGVGGGGWNVLKDDLMMGSKLKDWDKGSDSDDGDNE